MQQQERLKQINRMVYKLGIVWGANSSYSLTELMDELIGRKRTPCIVHKIRNGTTGPDGVYVGYTCGDDELPTDDASIEGALNDLI